MGDDFEGCECLWCGVENDGEDWEDTDGFCSYECIDAFIYGGSVYMGGVNKESL